MSASDPELPVLAHFRLEIDRDGIAHLSFDMADSPVNILSQATIAEIGIAAAWFETADVRGLILQSARQMFCAGGDLAELGAAYDRIQALPPGERSAAARAHFAPLNRHLLRLERCGKPVVAAIAGPALGGGCELALAAHHRVLADTPSAMLGLPEVPIGLMPGAGGTQRLPRLIGVEAALPILLDGLTLSSRQAHDAGIVDALVAPGSEIDAARAWILAAPSPVQRWQTPGWKWPGPAPWRATLAAARTAMLARTAGNYPAPIAVFDCLDRGLDLPVDQAIDVEIDAFAALIQRPEPRNMIRALFVGAQGYGRRRKAGTLPPDLDTLGQAIDDALAAARARLAGEGIAGAVIDDVVARLGFGTAGVATGGSAADDDRAAGSDYWFERADAGDAGRIARIVMHGAARACAGVRQTLPACDHAIVDHAAIRLHGFPAWSGGPIAWLDRLQHAHPSAQTEFRP